MLTHHRPVTADDGDIMAALCLPECDRHDVAFHAGERI
jgi:hypothetical protein